MKIITVPHPTLRTTAVHVPDITPAVTMFINELESTLAKSRNPKGVGLAAPQVNTPWRIFTTRVDEPLTFINPIITGKSTELTFGENPDEPVYEGCLSIPGIYGEVPRASWVEVAFDWYDTTTGKHTQVERRFNDFHARVIQHEFDHLEGVLFIDYSLKYDIPVYSENKKTKKFEEVDRSILEVM